ncbi:MAG: rhomboid family intramembrane serine protease [Parvularculaceae bacterium]
MNPADAPATFALILANVAASLYGLFVDRKFINNFLFNVGAVTRGRQHYRMITSAFLHGDLGHLFVNMLTLYFFGPVVEKLLGADGFLVIYFGSLLSGKFLSLYVNRKTPAYSALGASGAVSGVVLSFCLFYPLANIYLFLIPIGIPAIVFAALYMAVSMLLMKRPDRVIGHDAHLGGAAGGIVLTLLMRPDVVGRFFS